MTKTAQEMSIMELIAAKQWRKREIASYARIANFLTSPQIARLEKLADEHDEYKKEIERRKRGVTDNG